MNFSRHFQKYRKMITIVVIVILLVSFDLSPFGGNIRFYSTWIECGRKPVESGLSAGQPIYYKESASIEPLRLGYTKYFCSPLQAEQAGYSANPDRYEFPNLTK